MKILDILVKENFDVVGQQPDATQRTAFSASDLNSLQLRTLNRLRDGVDMDTMSPREFQIVMDLLDLGLVDEDGNVVDDGTSMDALPSPTRAASQGEDEFDIDNVDNGDNDLEDVIDFDIGKARATDY